MERREAKRRLLYRAVAPVALAAALNIASLGIDPQNFQRVWGALFNRAPDCAADAGSNNQERTYNIGAMPGAGETEIKNGKLVPNKAARERLLAGWLLYREDIIPKMLLLDGTKGLDRAYLEEISEGAIPANAIDEDPDSSNTATNVRALVRYMEKAVIQNAVLVTSDAQVPRIKVMICAYGANVAVKSAEEIIIKQNPQEAAAIRQEDASLEGRVNWFVEKLKTASLLLGSHGQASMVVRGID